MTAFKCKVIGDMTIVIDNVMECIATEIEVERPKNILISCIYRTPRSCIDQFNERIYELHEKHKDDSILTCGDFNIDLLKFNDHMKTKEFVNMFSLSLHPLIVKPSRITKDAATLIDNIFTNVTDVKTVSELLVTDVDHLPVFAVLEMNKRLKAGTNTEISNLVRIKSWEAIMALEADLMNHDWQDVYVDNTNQSWCIFRYIFVILWSPLSIERV